MPSSECQSSDYASTHTHFGPESIAGSVCNLDGIGASLPPYGEVERSENTLSGYASESSYYSSIDRMSETSSSVNVAVKPRNGLKSVLFL